MSRFNFDKWSLWTFLKGRKKLLVVLIGAIVGYLATQNPLVAGIAGATAELLYAIIDYYVQP